MSELGDIGFPGPPGNGALDQRYMVALGDLLIPAGVNPLEASNSGVWPSANGARALRVICGKSGTLSDVQFHVAVQAGNYDLGVYDVGETAGGGIGTRTLKASKGSTALPAAGWSGAWNPNLPVYRGQHLDIALALSDAATAAVVRLVNVALAAQTQLPSGYLTPPGGGGAAPKLAWQNGAMLPLAATVTEANCGQTQHIPLIIGRIT